jgi:serine protease Do
MTSSSNTPRKSITKKMAAVLVASTVVGAGVTAFNGVSTAPAIADAVRIETPAAAPGFADIIEQVSPAVVSVRVKSDIQPASSAISALAAEVSTISRRPSLQEVL